MSEVSEAETAAFAGELQTAITISDHGMKRVRERLGLKAKAVPREIVRAQERGIKRTDTQGRLRRTLDHFFLRHGAFGDYRVYRNFIWIFKGDQFVTLFALSNGLHTEKAASGK